MKTFLNTVIAKESSKHMQCNSKQNKKKNTGGGGGGGGLKKVFFKKCYGLY